MGVPPFLAMLPDKFQATGVQNKLALATHKVLGWVNGLVINCTICDHYTSLIHSVFSGLAGFMCAVNDSCSHFMANMVSKYF